MEFRLFGEMSFSASSKSLALGTPRQQAVLAALMVDTGQPVSIDTLVDRVWDSAPPQEARNVLYSHVSRIRLLLRRAAALAGERVARVERRNAGYVLHLDPELVDLHRFWRLVGAGLDRRGADTARVAALAEGLALWRATPLAAMSGNWVAQVRGKWHRRRLDAVVNWAELQLDAGRAVEVISSLSELIAEYPLVEPLEGLLMRALCAVGRNVEALDRYNALRHRLADEFGTDPSTELGALHQAILRGDLPRPAERITVPAPVPRQLPAAPVAFVGREHELARLTAALDTVDGSDAVISAVTGPGGIGKTSLVLHWAHRHLERFPDGQLFVDLRGFTPGSEPTSTDTAIHGFLAALGVAPERVPAGPDAQVALYRSLIAGRRMLLILDNAANVSQVVPLLPGTAGCLTIVTSRHVLPTLPHGQRLALDLLSYPEAIQLLALTAGAGRVDAEIDAAATTVRRCGRLPLAIRLAGARLAARPHWPVNHLAQRLSDEHRRLDELKLDHLAVRASFAVSVDQLANGPRPQDRLAADVYALLGLLKSPVVSTVVASRLVDLPEHETEEILEHLTDLHLLETPAPHWYRLHDLLHIYARERAEHTVSRTDRAAAISRVLTLFVGAAWRYATLTEPWSMRVQWVNESWAGEAPDFRDAREASVWLDEHRAQLFGVATTPDVPPDLVVRLVLGSFRFYLNRSHTQEWIALEEAGLDAAGAGADRAAAAMIRMDLGLAHAQLSRPARGAYYAEALTHIWRSLAMFEAIDNDELTVTCLINLGTVLMDSNDFDGATPVVERGERMARQLGNRRSLRKTTALLGILHARLGNSAQSLTYFKESLAINKQLGDEQTIAIVLFEIGRAYRKFGHLEEALDALEESRGYFRRVDNPRDQESALEELALLHLDRGDHRTALTVLADGLSMARRRADVQSQERFLHHVDTANSLARKNDARFPARTDGQHEGTEPNPAEADCEERLWTPRQAWRTS